MTARLENQILSASFRQRIVHDVLKKWLSLNHLILNIPWWLGRKSVHQIHEPPTISINRESIHHKRMTNEFAAISDTHNNA
jgi:hypothetical protein